MQGQTYTIPRNAYTDRVFPVIIYFLP